MIIVELTQVCTCKGANQRIREAIFPIVGWWNIWRNNVAQLSLKLWLMQSTAIYRHHVSTDQWQHRNKRCKPIRKRNKTGHSQFSSNFGRHGRHLRFIMCTPRAIEVMWPVSFRCWRCSHGNINYNLDQFLKSSVIVRILCKPFYCFSASVWSCSR